MEIDSGLEPDWSKDEVDAAFAAYPDLKNDGRGRRCDCSNLREAFIVGRRSANSKSKD